MTTTPAGNSVRDRRRKPWITAGYFGLAFVVLYVASIGPLAGLEAHGYGTPSLWRSLRPAYSPILWSWKYGPDWWATALGKYTRLFHVNRGCMGMWLYSFASNNEADAYRQWKAFLERTAVSKKSLQRELKMLELTLQLHQP